jgi:hypothetical protein
LEVIAPKGLASFALSSGAIKMLEWLNKEIEATGEWIATIAERRRSFAW